MDGADGPDAASTDVELRTWHDVLLSASGRLPDELVSLCRTWLADGRVRDVDRAMTFAGGSAEAVRAFPDVSGGPVRWVHAPAVVARPGGAGAVGPPLLDLSAAPGGRTAADEAVVQVVSATAGVRGAWRSFRLPAAGSRWPAPALVTVVDVSGELAPGPVVGLAADVARALGEQGVAAPLVEVVDGGAALPWSARQALTSSALLWADEPSRPLRTAGPDHQLAGASDGAGPPGAALAEEADELSGIAAYLAAAPVVASRPGRDRDQVTGAAGAVPRALRSDGSWLWPESVHHLWATHGRSPEPDFLAHLRAQVRSGAGPRPDLVQWHRCSLAALEGSSGGAW